MSETISLASIPGLMSSNPEAVLNGIIEAALKGIKVYLTSYTVDKLKTYFDKLGIEVKEARNPESDSYILLALEGAKLRVEIHENGKITSSKNFKLEVFISALENYIEKRKGSSEGTRLYEFKISKELLERLKGEGEEK